MFPSPRAVGDPADPDRPCAPDASRRSHAPGVRNGREDRLAARADADPGIAQRRPARRCRRRRRRRPRTAATATHTDATYATDVAFFAALDPRVWDALDRAPQQRWRRALWDGHAPLVVRSIGVRTEILARAKIGNTLVRPAQRHGLDAHAQRWALLPVALRSLPPAAAHNLIAAMPPPPTAPARSSSLRAGAMRSESSRPPDPRCARPPISHARSRCSAAGTSSCRFTITAPRFGTRCADGRGMT